MLKTAMRHDNAPAIKHHCSMKDSEDFGLDIGKNI